MATVKDILPIWERIEKNAGTAFWQIKGGEFTYLIAYGCLIPDRTSRKISRSDFEKALALVPLSGTTEIQHLQGPSYIFAVLMDKRIRKSDW